MRLHVHIFTIGVVSLVIRVAVERKSLDDLRDISGIGATKLERYGQPLIEIVRGLARD